MEPKTERKPTEQLRTTEPPEAPKKRFRIEKLEERIAPKKGDNSSATFSGGVSVY